MTYSEPHHRWSVGGLYDNVSDKEFSLMTRLRYGSGHGWAGANYVLQTSDDLVEWHNSGEAIQAGPSGTEIIQTLPENPADRQFYRLVEIK